MNLYIREVLDHATLKVFIRFGNRLYAGNPCHVPALFPDEYNTLRRDRNPAFDHCQARYWMAYLGEKPVGRIAAILNHAHIQKWGQRYMRFGWLDFVDDRHVSAALFQQVENWASEMHCTAIHGPLGFTDLDREGMLVEGFDELGTLATIYNFPYYPAHLEALGYTKDIDWLEYEISVPPQPDPRIARLADIVLRRCHLKVLQARSKSQLLAYAPALFELINAEYEHLYGVVPLTQKQIESYVHQYFGFVSPDLVPVILDENDRMVAFGISMPSLSRALQKSGGELFPLGFWHLLRALRRSDRLDLYLVAVRSEYQGMGVNAVLIDRIQRACNRRGIRFAETNPELENNHLVQAQWKHFNTRQHKRRRCFIKRLEADQALRA
ncbi:MAG: hypothetical protein HPY45_14205 [Anaerolineae bacterium]|nr:hypothetical protein [Anaerolineae bacterium]